MIVYQDGVCKSVSKCRARGTNLLVCIMAVRCHHHVQHHVVVGQRRERVFFFEHRLEEKWRDKRGRITLLCETSRFYVDVPQLLSERL